MIGGPNGSGKTAVLEACLLAAGHEGLIVGKAGADAIRIVPRDYKIETTIRVHEQTYSQKASARAAGHSQVPFAYFSSWRSPQLVGALGITAGKRGKRPAKTEGNRLWNIKQFLVNARAHEFFPTATKTASSRYEAVTGISTMCGNRFSRGWSFWSSRSEIGQKTVSMYF